MWSSFGNPLNFGAYMVMTIPATLAMVIPNRDRRFMWLGILAIALGLQIAGLWFTGGRGPYISFVAALIAFGVIGIAIGQFKSLTSAGLALLGGVLVAVIIVVLPSPQDDIGIERLLSIGDQVVGFSDAELDRKSGLDARFDIWGTTFDVATGWDSPQKESSINSVLRPVFGLGPDMFVYTYPLVADPQSGNNLVDHPHNYELQILMEQGFIGLLLLLGLLVALIATIYRTTKLLKSRTEGIDFSSVLLLAFAPAIVGKIVEMQTGVSRVSELTMSFALFGAISAIWVLSSSKFPLKEQSESTTSERHKSALGFSLKPTAISGISILAALAVTVVVFITLVGWDLRRTTASRSWSAAITATNDIDRATGWFESQTDAPERPLFTNSLFVELFNASIDQHNLENEDNALQLMHTARSLLLDFEKRDPFKRDVQINLFITEARLTSWGQTEFAESAIERSQSIFELYPAYPSMLQIVANNMTLVGRDDLAAEYSEIIKSSN